MTVTNLQKPEYDIQLVWDPVQNLDLDHYEVWRSPFLLIVAVSTGSKKFTIDGLLGSWFADGDSLIVTGSTGNDGTYTIAGGGGGANSRVTGERSSVWIFGKTTATVAMSL